MGLSPHQLLEVLSALLSVARSESFRKTPELNMTVARRLLNYLRQVKNKYGNINRNHEQMDITILQVCIPRSTPSKSRLGLVVILNQAFYVYRIQGSYRGAYEEFCLLGYNAV
jgi:hypothetical protein